MASATVTLGVKDVKTGTGPKGAWALSIFSGSDSQEYVTFDSNLASKVKSLDGQLLAVDYEVEVNKKGYTSNVVKGVQPATNGATPTAAPATTFTTTAPAKGEFRTKEQIMWTDALTLAHRAYYAAQLDPIEGLDGLLKYAEDIYNTILEKG